MGLGAAATVGSDIFGGIASGLGGLLGGRQQRKAAEVQAAAQAREGTANRQLTREQAALQEAMQQRQRQAEGIAAPQVFGELTGAAGQQEQRLTDLFSQAPPELQTLKEDILSGQSEQLQTGTRALEAQLAQEGVRGGQAATQLRRGTGEMTEDATRDINRIMAQEAIGRQQSETGYRSQLASMLQGRAYDPTLLGQKTGAFSDIKPVSDYDKLVAEGHGENTDIDKLRAAMAKAGKGILGGFRYQSK